MGLTKEQQQELADLQKELQQLNQLLEAPPITPSGETGDKWAKISRETFPPEETPLQTLVASRRLPPNEAHVPTPEEEAIIPSTPTEIVTDAAALGSGLVTLRAAPTVLGGLLAAGEDISEWEIFPWKSLPKATAKGVNRLFEGLSAKAMEKSTKYLESAYSGVPKDFSDVEKLGAKSLSFLQRLAAKIDISPEEIVKADTKEKAIRLIRHHLGVSLKGKEKGKTASAKDIVEKGGKKLIEDILGVGQPPSVKEVAIEDLRSFARGLGIDEADISKAKTTVELKKLIADKVPLTKMRLLQGGKAKSVKPLEDSEVTKGLYIDADKLAKVKSPAEFRKLIKDALGDTPTVNPIEKIPIATLSEGLNIKAIVKEKYDRLKELKRLAKSLDIDPMELAKATTEEQYARIIKSHMGMSSVGDILEVAKEYGISQEELLGAKNLDEIMEIVTKRKEVVDAVASPGKEIKATEDVVSLEALKGEARLAGIPVDKIEKIAASKNPEAKLKFLIQRRYKAKEVPKDVETVEGWLAKGNKPTVEEPWTKEKEEMSRRLLEENTTGYLLSDEGKEYLDALDEAIQFESESDKFYSGLPLMSETIGKLRNSRFFQRIKFYGVSPKNFSDNPLFQRAFGYHHKSYLMKRKTIAEIMDKYPIMHTKYSKQELLNVGEALESPKGSYGLSDKEKDLFYFYRRFYKGALRLYVERFAGKRTKDVIDAADIIVGYGSKLKDEDMIQQAVIDTAKQLKFDKKQTRALEVLVRSKRMGSNYMPHVFNSQELENYLETQLLILSSKAKLNKLEIERKNKYFQMLFDLQNKGTVGFSHIPRDVSNKFFKPRLGLDMYERDPHKAFLAYLQGWATETFDQKALDLWHTVIPKLEKTDPLVADYSKRFLQEYLGLRKHSQVWSTIRSLEWSRTLGGNISSPILNLSQQVNTIAGAGPKYSAAAYKALLTPGSKLGNQLRAIFKRSGLAEESMEVMYPTTKVSPYIETLRRILGALFTRAEYANRLHAFSAFYLKGLSKGLKGEDLFFYATHGMHTTQFEYGKFGMPFIARGELGTVFQFISFPIKSLEFIKDLKGPGLKGYARPLIYLGMVEGGRLTAKSLLDTDMSNSFGIGVRYADLLETIKYAKREDLEGALYHLKGVFGGGMLSPSMGPVVQLFAKSAKIWKENGRLDELQRELSMVQWNKLSIMFAAMDNKKGDLYPIYDFIDPKAYLDPRVWSGKKKAPVGRRIKYYLTLPELVQKTFLFPSTRQKGMEHELMMSRLAKSTLNKMANDFYHAAVNGDIETATKIMTSPHDIYPSRQGIMNEAERQYRSDYEKLTTERTKRLEHFKRGLE